MAERKALEGLTYNLSRRSHRRVSLPAIWTAWSGRGSDRGVLSATAARGSLGQPHLPYPTI